MDELLKKYTKNDCELMKLLVSQGLDNKSEVMGLLIDKAKDGMDNTKAILKPLLMVKLIVELGTEICPNYNQILCAYNCKSIEELKLIVLGQEPYTQIDGDNNKKANGYSFLVNKDYKYKNKRDSLNFLKEACPKIFSRDNLTEDNKIMFINTCLTNEIKGEGGKHAVFGWNKFNEIVLKEIAEQNGNVKIVALGKVAKNLAEKVGNNIEVINLDHPGYILRKSKKEYKIELEKMKSKFDELLKEIKFK